jgi:hypothetical protein
MKRMNWILFAVFVVLGSGITQAQTEKVALDRTTRQVLDIWITNTETHLIPLADALPEDKYSFAPTNGEFKGVRTFAEQVKHLASFNFLAANLILRRTPTRDQREETGPVSVKTKAEIIDYLKNSFALLHQAVSAHR